jgi:hypothetical protein
LWWGKPIQPYTRVKRQKVLKKQVWSGLCLLDFCLLVR